MTMKLFCDCIKDATVQSVHVPAAMDRKRRAANRTMSSTSASSPSTMTPGAALDDEEQDESDIVRGSKSWKLPLNIMKADADQQLIFGWASVVEKDGKAVIDKQGDIIPVEELENAAYTYVTFSRDGGDMHSRRGVAKLVESMVFTKDKQAALNIDLGQVGWWVGFKVSDAELWAAHKRGERPEFSIGGAAIPIEVDDNIFKRGGRQVLRRHPFDSGAAGAVHHVIERLFSNQRAKLLHEYTNNTVFKASDRVSRIIQVLDEDDEVLKNSIESLSYHIARAAQRTGAEAGRALIGDPSRRLKPEEQARLRAISMPLADNVDYWTKQYGMKRAAELVGRMYDKKGELVVKPNAEWNINATTNEVAARLVAEALDKNWKVATLSRRLEKTGLFDSVRASMIARTEISMAQNTAMLRAGYEYQTRTGKKLLKIWMLGPNPCPICQENEGEEMALDDVFESGNFVPPVHPNCMCEIQLILA